MWPGHDIYFTYVLLYNFIEFLDLQSIHLYTWLVIVHCEYNIKETFMHICMKTILCFPCAFPVLGEFDVVNFRDVTAENDLGNSTIFEFEFDPVTSLDTSFGYDLRLSWSQVSGPSSGVIEAAAAHCEYYGRSNVRLERVKHTGTYRLYVPLNLFGEGRLLVNMSINFSCIRYQYRYWYRYRCIRDYCRYNYERVCTGCNDWQIRGNSDSLEISAKRG